MFMKKGITPIVSVVLLLLLTIALAGGVMVWLTGYTGGLQEDILVKSSNCLRKNSTHVDVRTILFNAGQQEIDNQSLDLSFLSGPTDLSDTTSYNITHKSGDDISAGQQEVITFSAFNETAGATIESGTYQFDLLSSNSVARVAVQCP